MKKIVLSVIVALIAITANAQVYVGGTFGVGSDKVETEVSIRPRACFFPLFSFLPLWLHYNLNPLCVQY